MLIDSDTPCCNGLCHQGRRLCPTPRECHLDDDRPPISDGDLVLALSVLLLAIVAAICFGVL